MTPIITTIALSLQAALQAVVAGGSYYNTIKPTSVVLDMVDLSTIPMTEVPYVIVGARIEPVDREFGQSQSRGGGPLGFGSISDRWRFVLHARIDIAGFDSGKKLAALAQLEADIETAVLVDARRGGVAMMTYPMQANRYTGLANSNQCFLEMPVEVLLRRNLGQPST